ncbi:MAG: ABC transporter permease [Actinobacteria bacterium]|nr:ABC transporter permease [Actinomycetota bacterium]
MRALSKLTLLLAKLYMRDPIAVFFTLLFAPLLVVLLGLVFGNDPDPIFGGRGYLETNLPAYAAIVIGIVGLLIVPINTVSRRKTGALRRFRVTPLRPLTYIAADALVYFVMGVLGIVLLFLVGTVGFGIQPQGSIGEVFLAASVGAFAFLAVGYVLAGIAPTVQVAQVIGNVPLFPMLIFSGATAPLEVMPERVQSVARLFPLTQVVTLMRGIWLGEVWSSHLTETVILVGLCLVGVAVASWLFRWE